MTYNGFFMHISGLIIEFFNELSFFFSIFAPTFEGVLWGGGSLKTSLKTIHLLSFLRLIFGSNFSFLCQTILELSWTKETLYGESDGWTDKDQ